MAKNISVKSIRDLAKEQGLNEIKSIEINGLEIEIKKYIPIEKKREIALLVNQNSFVGKGDLKLYDKALEDIMFCVLLVREYTNINLMKDYYEFYDCLKVSGLLESILSYIDEDEIKEIKELIESRKNDNYRVQELRGHLGYQLESLFNIISDKLGDVSEQIANFNPETLKTLTSFIPKEQQDELLSRRMTKEEKERIQKLDDENIEKKIKIVEEKVSEFTKVEDVEKNEDKSENSNEVEKNDLSKSPTLNDNEAK